MKNKALAWIKRIARLSASKKFLIYGAIFTFISACSTPQPVHTLYENESSFVERLSGSRQFLPPNELNEVPTPLPMHLDAWNDQEAALTKAWTAFQAQRYAEAHSAAQNMWDKILSEKRGDIDEELSRSPVREVALLLAASHLQAQSFLQGRGLLERLIRVGPQWEPAWHLLYSHYTEIKSYHIAFNIAQTAMDRIKQPSFLIFANLIESHWHLLDYAAASKTVERGIRLFPQASLLIAWRGILEFQQGFFTQSCEHLALAYEREKSDPTIAHNYTLCLIHGRSWDEAHKVLQLAIGQNPQSAKLLLLLGSLFHREGQKIEAKKAWTEYLARTSDPKERSQIEAMMRY